jgi:hypothetical protein
VRQAAEAAAQFDLVLQMADEGATLSGQLQFSRDLFTGDTAGRMAGHYAVRTRRGSAGLMCQGGAAGHAPAALMLARLRIGAAGMQALLESAAAAPDAHIQRLTFVSTAERALVLSAFNATDAASSELMHRGQTMHGALEHWAAVQPDAPALVFEARARAARMRGHACGRPASSSTSRLRR